MGAGQGPGRLAGDRPRPPSPHARRRAITGGCVGTRAANSRPPTGHGSRTRPPTRPHTPTLTGMLPDRRAPAAAAREPRRRRFAPARAPASRACAGASRSPRARPRAPRGPATVRGRRRARQRTANPTGHARTGRRGALGARGMILEPSPGLTIGKIGRRVGGLDMGVSRSERPRGRPGKGRSWCPSAVARQCRRPTSRVCAHARRSRLEDTRMLVATGARMHGSTAVWCGPQRLGLMAAAVTRPGPAPDER
jgi:hypothetical protein